MTESHRNVLTRMQERLIAALMSGPSLNCRPHNSRQRIDLSDVQTLGDTSAIDLLRELLSDSGVARITAKVPPPAELDTEEKRLVADVIATTEDVADPAQPIASSAELSGPTEQDRAREADAWRAQQRTVAKLAAIAEDARTYEQETGAAVLYIGFPILSLPPGGEGRRFGATSRRIMAPLAFMPINLSVRRGARPTIDLDCRGEGADRVVPNVALLAWLEQQTGASPDGLFADDAGAAPWTEIAELVRHAGRSLEIDVPATFSAADVVAIPADFSLRPVPRSDKTESRPAILDSAIIGLFPAVNQGLLRDTQEMLRDGTPAGPIDSFLRVGLDLGTAPTPAAADPQEPATAAGRRKRIFADERHVLPADPCQLRAMRLARNRRGLVIHGPPGTGKSQTIANIIADHLARGQRVLFVCDKRTALDVVANRLNQAGLGSLCAVIHDVRREQSDLYMNIREQLESLAERSSIGTAAKRVERLDAQLQTIHDDLSAFASALHTSDDSAPSVHTLVGEWLRYRENAIADLSLSDDLSIDDIQNSATALRESFERAEATQYETNPWKNALAGTTADFLAIDPAELRASMSKAVELARSADAQLRPDDPPFDPNADLGVQVEKRTELARRLADLGAVVPSIVVSRLLELGGEQLARSESDFAGLEQALTALRAEPLDAALRSMYTASGLTLARVANDLAALTEYLAARRSLFGFLAFGAKKRATAVLTPLALILSRESAERVHRFLGALFGRLLLSDWLHRARGEHSAAKLLIDDDELFAGVRGSEAFFRSVGWAAKEPALRCVYARLREAVSTADGIAQFTRALENAAPRAAAVSVLLRSLESMRMLSRDAVAQLDRDMRGGAEIGTAINSLADHFETIESLLRMNDVLADVLPSIAAAVRTCAARGADFETAVSSMLAAAASGALRRRIAIDRTLTAVDAQRVSSWLGEYKTLEGQKLAAVREATLHLWLERQKSRLLASTQSRLSSLGATMRQRLVTRGRNAMRLRQVIAVGAQTPEGDPLFDVCPVWMASPETVAQIFPREPIFDIVIFDEASQCRLEEALPVLTRGRRVVIAGDPKQLPPTRFFETGVAQSESEEIESDQDLFEVQQSQTEDLLGAALNLSIEQSYLDVHYRSRNSELIEFSNAHFYARRLQPIPGHPANRAVTPPLILYNAGGVYQDRCNPAEARAVARVVRDLLKRAVQPSIGIACFNLQQRDLIIATLDSEADHDPEFAGRLAAARSLRRNSAFEGFFVRNLENVQGDERDHIIISTTYGPDEQGRFYRRFGPLGRAGGGRRLNVLVTRAREEVHLVTSIPATVWQNLPPIPDGQTPGGAWLLFAYLGYAAALAGVYRESRDETSGPSIAPLDDDAASDPPTVSLRPTRYPSEAVEQLAERLAVDQGLGSQVYWGNDGFCIDLALRKSAAPDDVTVGVLLDYARYANSDDIVEWDIFRTAIHESQGWKLERIWSPQVFRDLDGVGTLLARSAQAAAASRAREQAKIPPRER